MSLELELFFRNLMDPPEIYILLIIICPLFPPTSQSSVFVHLGQIDCRLCKVELTSTSGGAFKKQVYVWSCFRMQHEWKRNSAFSPTFFQQLWLCPPLSVPSIWLERGSPHDSSGSGITATGVAARISYDPLWYHSVWCLTYTFIGFFGFICFCS